MTTVHELYESIYPHALAAYAQKNSDSESAKQMARALSAECARECARLGIVAGGDDGVVAYSSAALGTGSPGVPAFAPPVAPFGPGAAALVAPGTPQQPAQHYNYPGTQPGQARPEIPASIGGQQLFPPAGAKYTPPDQAGVVGSVTQAPTPQGYNALGTNGVINVPEQRPNGKDVVVNPSNQPMIPAVGGAGTTFVPERIVR